MQEDEILDQQVKALMFDLMLVLYAHGMTSVNVGGLMRMLGVNDATAQHHDSEELELTDEFAKYVKEARNTKRPDDATLH